MKRTYNQITYQKRCEIIRQICYEKCKINEVAKKLKVNISTIKAIIQKFKRQGILFARSKGNYQRKVDKENCFHSCIIDLPKQIFNNVYPEPEKTYFSSFQKESSPASETNLINNSHQLLCKNQFLLSQPNIQLSEQTNYQQIANTQYPWNLIRSMYVTQQQTCQQNNQYYQSLINL